MFKFLKSILMVFLLLFLFSGVSYGASEWDKAEIAGTRAVSDLDYYIIQNNTALDRVLANYNTVVLTYNSAAQLTASIGEVVCSNSDGSTRKMRQNPSATTVTWANIDTGAEAASSTYYVWGNCDADATTATFNISLSSTIGGLTGITSAKKIGSFYNNSSSDIDRTKIYTSAYAAQPTDSSGMKSIQSIYDYGTSGSSFTSKTGGLKVAFGKLEVTANSTKNIENLPFSGSSTFSCTASMNTTDSALHEPAHVSLSGGTTLSLTNASGIGSGDIKWICIGY